MRHKDTGLMQTITAFVERFYLEEDRSPTTTDIANAVGISRSSAYRYLVAMNDRGLISYDGAQIETPKTKLKSASRPAEVYNGAIPCGTPETIEAAIDEIVPLPVSIFGEGDLFVIRTSGDSMIEAGIESDDLVVVRRQERADIGDIVVALCDNENTLKRLTYDDEIKKYVLHPENRSMEDIVVDSGDLKIQGVAKYLIKAL